MNLAVRDIRHNLGRFLLTCLGLSLLLAIVMSMIGIYRGLVPRRLPWCDPPPSIFGWSRPTLGVRSPRLRASRATPAKRRPRRRRDRGGGGDLSIHRYATGDAQAPDLSGRLRDRPARRPPGPGRRPQHRSRPFPAGRRPWHRSQGRQSGSNSAGRIRGCRADQRAGLVVGRRPDRVRDAAAMRRSCSSTWLRPRRGARSRAGRLRCQQRSSSTRSSRAFPRTCRSTPSPRACAAGSISRR